MTFAPIFVVYRDCTTTFTLTFTLLSPLICEMNWTSSASTEYLIQLEKNLNNEEIGVVKFE
jgi:hypothetical protein